MRCRERRARLRRVGVAVDDRRVADVSGSRSVLERVEGLLQVDVSGGDAGDHAGAAVAPQGVLATPAAAVRKLGGRYPQETAAVTERRLRRETEAASSIKGESNKTILLWKYPPDQPLQSLPPFKNPPPHPPVRNAFCSSPLRQMPSMQKAATKLQTRATQGPGLGCEFLL